MRGSARTDHYQAAPQQPAFPQNQPKPVQQQTVPPPEHNAQQVPRHQVAYQQQPPRACFNCGDPAHFVADCLLQDRAQKPMQQLINSHRTKPAGEWTCPSNPHSVNNDIVPAALLVHRTVTFCIICGRTGHAASECLVHENATTEEQLKAAGYAPDNIPAECTDSDEHIRGISTSEEGGPSRPVVVTCGEKQILTTLEAPAPDCTKILISIHLVLSAEQKAHPNFILSQLKEELSRNTNLTIASNPLPHLSRKHETKLAQVQKVKTNAPVVKRIMSMVSI